MLVNGVRKRAVAQLVLAFIGLGLVLMLAVYSPAARAQVADSSAFAAPGAYLQLELTNAQGAPISSAELVLFPAQTDSAPLPSYRQLTDANGKAVFPALNSGSYRLELRHVAYQPISRQLQVQAQDSQRIRLTLADTAIALQEVEILSSEPFVGSWRDLQSWTLGNRLPSTGTTLLGREALLNTGVQDLGQAVQRFPGVSNTLMGAPTVRGLPMRYVPVMLNGWVTPGQMAANRSLPLELLAVRLLQGVTLTNTGRGELPGTVTAGLLSAYTPTPPDSFTAEVSLGLGWDTQTTGRQGWTLSRQTGDALGLGVGPRSLPETLPSAEVLQQGSIEQRLQAGGRLAREQGYSWSETSLPLGTSLQGPNGQFSFQAGNTWRLSDGRSLGLVGGLQYRNTRQRRLLDRQDADSAVTYLNFSQEQLTQRTDWSLQFDLRYRLAPNHLIEFSNTYSTAASLLRAEAQGSLRAPGADTSPDVRQPLSLFTEQYRQLIFSEQRLRGAHSFNSGVELNWDLMLGGITETLPAWRSLTYTASEATLGRMALVTGQDNQAPFPPHESHWKWDESRFGGFLKLRIPIKQEVLVAGSRLQTREVNYGGRRLGYTPYGDLEQANQIALRTQQPQHLFTPETQGYTGWVLTDWTAPQDSYRAEAFTQTYFLNWSHNFVQHGFHNLVLTTGLRAEVFTQALFIPELAADSTQVDTTYADLLPYLELDWSRKPQNESALRSKLSLWRSLSRPKLHELAPQQFAEPSTAWLRQGNPELVRTTVWNAEWLNAWSDPANQFSVSASLFYKYLLNPIEETAALQQQPNGTALLLGYRNLPGDAHLAGWSLDWFFRFAANSPAEPGNSPTYPRTPYWSLQGNVVYTQSWASLVGSQDVWRKAAQTRTRPLQGQIPWVVNGGLAYVMPRTNWRFNAWLHYAGRQLMLTGTRAYPDVWQAPRTVVNLQAAKTWKLQARNSARTQSRLTLRLDVTDLFAPDWRLYQQLPKGASSPDAPSEQLVQKLNAAAQLMLTLSWRY